MSKVKKWKPVPGETFYFIYPTEYRDQGSLEKDDLDINHPEYVLTIGEAESYEPSFDTQSNCFRTKTQAKRALQKIKDALKFTGEL